MRIAPVPSHRLPLAPIDRSAAAGRRRGEDADGEAGARDPRAGPGLLPPARSLVVVLPDVPMAEALHAARTYRAAIAGPSPLPPGTMLRLAV